MSTVAEIQRVCRHCGEEFYTDNVDQWFHSSICDAVFNQSCGEEADTSIDVGTHYNEHWCRDELITLVSRVDDIVNDPSVCFRCFTKNGVRVPSFKSESGHYFGLCSSCLHIEA